MKYPKIPPDRKSTLRGKSVKTEIFKYMGRADVREYINSVNQRYLFWEELIHRSHPPKTKLELLWQLIKFNRNSNIKSISISKAKDFTFKYTITDAISHKLHEFDLNMGGTLRTQTLIPDEDKDMYLISSIMEEAIASSQLEGAVTSRKAAKEMLINDRKPINKSERMILNNYLANLKIKDLGRVKLTPKMILDIHASLVKDTLDDKRFEGKFRISNDIHVVDNMTGKIFYNPPDYKRIPVLIRDFCEFANKDDKESFIHPIIKASILHFLMGYIHPFIDGNGRTARALFYWYLISHGYWLLEYTSISKTIIRSPSQYARAYLYSELDENDLTYFVLYQIKKMDQALQDLKDYIKLEIKEKEALYDYIGVGGINSRQLYVLKKLSDQPKKTFTIRALQNKFGVVYQTARTDLLELEKLGFLQKRVVGKKKLLFIRASGFEGILNRHLKKKGSK
ncbi:MAG: Fic family protein [Candidatus Woesearchaeota archaeon]